jgi:ABC-2 type transport system permease protein
MKNCRGYRLVFEELDKSDFQEKVQSTNLGMRCAFFRRCCNAVIFAVVYTSFFGRNTPH